MPSWTDSTLRAERETRRRIRAGLADWAALALAPNLARYWFTTAREVEQGAAAVPDRIALIDDTGVLTYRQLRDDSRTLAAWLLDMQEERGLDELRLDLMQHIHLENNLLFPRALGEEVQHG